MPHAAILDVGCAAGYLMAHLQDSKGCHCVGIEQVRESAMAARNTGFRVLEDDALSGITSLAETDQFDHIIFGDVLEHLIDPMAVLIASRSLLRPSGNIIVSLPNIVSLHARATIALGIWRYHESGIFDKTHLRFYSVKTGRELLREAGYRITHEDFVGPLTFHGGRRLKAVIALRPNLLANQMIFAAVPISPST
jgi:methionine biosynthesis protein MetW